MRSNKRQRLEPGLSEQKYPYRTRSTISKSDEPAGRLKRAKSTTMDDPQPAGRLKRAKSTTMDDPQPAKRPRRPKSTMENTKPAERLTRAKRSTIMDDPQPAGRLKRAKSTTMDDPQPAERLKRANSTIMDDPQPAERIKSAKSTTMDDPQPAERIKRAKSTTMYDPQIKQLTKTTQNTIILDDQQPSTSRQFTSHSGKPKIRVLSLFDGIGTGYYTLKKLGFDIEVYYASEVDQDALDVTRSQFPYKIVQLGDVTNFIMDKKLDEIGPIDLLIGGSPCNDLSGANVNRRFLLNPAGSGPLFFYFSQIKHLLELRKARFGKNFYFMFENVASMRLEDKRNISLFLGCEPLVINSTHVSPQNRKRFYWTNLPRAQQVHWEMMTIIPGPLLSAYLDPTEGRTANVEKVLTITTKMSCLQDGSSKNPVQENGVDGGMTINEIERIFGFPTHYTDIKNFDKTRRQKLLGKAWSVQVIEALFRPLMDIFATK